MTFSSRKPKIYLVRHGESITNVARHLHQRVSDPAVWLTPKGHTQATQAGLFLTNHFYEQYQLNHPIRIMRSEYRRAIQTAHHIESSLKSKGFYNITTKEDHRLRELEFGFVGLINMNEHPHVQHLQSMLRYQNYKFLAKRYGGEAPTDVDNRIRHTLSAIYRDMAENGIDTFILVTHGLTMRVIIRALMSYDNAWYESEENPDNCAVRLINQGTDEGYLFPNPNGQWDANAKPSPEDASGLNANGFFFSPEDMERIINAQASQPYALQRIDSLLQSNPSMPTWEAVNQILGPQ